MANRAGDILSNFIQNMLFSMQQGYVAQGQARGPQARAAGIGAALGGPQLRQQILDQAAKDEEDRQLQIQKIKEAALGSAQDRALKLREALQGTPASEVTVPAAPVVPSDVGGGGAGLQPEGTRQIPMPLPSVQYPTGENTSRSLPITSAQQALEATLGTERAKLLLQSQAKGPPQRRLLNTAAGVIDIDNPEKGIIPGTAPSPPKETVPSSVAEYRFYVQDQAAHGKTPVSFDDWQTMDANRRKSLTTINAGSNAIGDFTKEGQDFLKTIPVQWRKTVEKIANYDEDPTKVASMRGGMREQLTQWVNQVNPAYDTTLYGNRAPTRKAFTTGTQGQQINAINTAIGHIDQLLNLAPQMNNSSFVAGNAMKNKIATAFGSDAATNFDTLKDALAGEISSVLSKGGATVSGIAEAKERIKSSSSPEQLAGYVKTILPVMGSKLNALDYQYHQAMGANDPFSALSPEAKTILRKNGINPDEPLGASSGPRAGYVIDPAGARHYVSDVDAAVKLHPGTKVAPQ